MSRFRKKAPRKVPSVNTAALPDMIFTLLFFFMIVAHIRPFPVLTKFEVPNVENLQDLKEKSQLIYIMVGEKTDENSQPTIQLNSSFSTIEELPEGLQKIKNEISSDEQHKIIVILKIDKNTEMGLVNDIRQILRQTGLLTVYYSAEKEL